MNRSLASAVVGLAACVLGGAPRAASADAVVTSANGQVTSLLCGTAATNALGQVVRHDKAGPTAADITSYDQQVQSHLDAPGGPSVPCGGNINDPTLVIGPMSADSSVRQTTTVDVAADSVVVESSATAAVKSTHVADNCVFHASASASTVFKVDIAITQPCNYRFVGSISTEADDSKASVLAQVSLEEGVSGLGLAMTAGIDAVGNDGRPLPHSQSIAGTGTFVPGTVSLQLTLVCGGFDNHLVPTGIAGAQARASWVVSFSLSPVQAGDDIRWTKRSGGGFGVAADWNPQQVPLHDATHANNAIFDVPAHYAVDFAVSKGGVKTLPAQRTSDRLEVLQGDVTLANANYKVDDLDLARPSLVVDVGKLTLASGQLTSNSATIGDLHGVGAEIDVAGTASRWDCLGALRVGGSNGSGGDGKLVVSGGATMTSAETRIGAGGRQLGFASARDEGTNWATGNLAVGHSSGGQLAVSGGARVTSDQAVVGFGQSAADVARVDVLGLGPTGAPSRWDMTELFVGHSDGLNLLNIVDGGTVNAADVFVGDIAGGTGIVSVSGVHASPLSASLLFVLHDATVGKNGGTGTIDVTDGGQVSVIDNLEIGSGCSGEIDVSHSPHGPAGPESTLTVGGILTVGNLLDGDGALVLTDGGVVECGQAIVGSLSGSLGTVEIDDSAVLHVTGDMNVGALGGAGIVGLNTGLLSVDGNLTIAGDGGGAGGSGAGAVVGTGVMVVKGAFTVNGFLEPETIAQLGNSPALSTSKRSAALRAKSATPPGGKLTIQGNLVVGPTGVIRVEAAGAQSDRLVVTGTATLDGTLVLQFKNGFAPKTGAQFEVLHADGAVTGSFTTVDVRGLAPGAQFDVTATGGALTATAKDDTVALPTVSVKASTRKLLEKQAKKKATLTFTRKGDSSQPLTVSYTTGGTATNGLDYVQLPGVVTIPAKKKFAKVTVQMVDDPFRESTETIDVAVVPGADYTESLASSVRIAIVDND